MSIRLAAGVALFGAFVALTMTAWSQHQALAATRHLLAAMQATAKGQAQVIRTMEDHAERNAQDSAELTETLQQVQQLAGEGRQIWESLKRENQEFKAWAESALPADVIRLRRRPAITGAAEYKTWLQQSRNLHTAGQPAPE